MKKFGKGQENVVQAESLYKGNLHGQGESSVQESGWGSWFAEYGLSL